MATYTYQTLIRCKEMRLLEVLPGIVSAPVHIDIRHEILDPTVRRNVQHYHTRGAHKIVLS